MNYTTSYCKIGTHMYTYIYVYVFCIWACSVVSNSLQPHGLYGLLCPWTFPGKKIGVGCHFLLQWIFPIQGSNRYLLHLFHRRQILGHLGHLGSPVCVYVCVYIYTNTAHISTIIGRSVGGMEGIQLSSLSQFVTTAILSFPGSGEAPLSSCLLFPGLFQPLLYTLENSSDSEWLLLLGAWQWEFGMPLRKQVRSSRRRTPTGN